VRPQAEIKAQWLAELFNLNGNYKLATLRAVVGVLYPSEQRNLLEPERERILAAVPILNAEASPEFLNAVVDVLSPGSCTQASVDRLARANADFAGMQPLIVQAYLVHQQNDAACLRMKALLQSTAQ